MVGLIRENLAVNGALETEDDLYQRAQQVKGLLSDFLAQHNLADDERVAVVCHSKLIAACTASGVDGVGAQAQLVDYVWTKNAEILPVEF